MLVIVIFALIKHGSYKAHIVFKNNVFKNDIIYIGESIDDKTIDRNVDTYLLESRSSAYSRMHYTITGSLNRSFTNALIEKTIAEKKDLTEITLNISPSGSNYDIYNQLSRLIIILRKNSNIKTIRIISSIPITKSYGFSTQTDNYITKLLYKNEHLESLTLNVSYINLHEITEGLEHNRALKQLVISSPSIDTSNLDRLRFNDENKVQSLTLTINSHLYHDMKSLVRIIDTTPSLNEITIESLYSTGDLLRYIILEHYKGSNRKMSVKSFPERDIYTSYDLNYEKKNQLIKAIRNVLFKHLAGVIINECLIGSQHGNHNKEAIIKCSNIYNEKYLASFEYNLRRYVDNKFFTDLSPYDLDKSSKSLLGEYPFNIQEEVKGL